MKPIQSVVLVAALAGAPASVDAQCSFDVGNVPDFDQRRQGALPGDGGMYCVPTAVTNWFAYFANRGLPQPTTLDGPRNWQSNFNYGRASSTIGLMGTFMGTSASSGTTGTGGLFGATVYQAFHAQGKVAVTHYWCGGGYCPTPTRMAVMRALGGFIAPCYGRYQQSPAGFYTRNGGHCITVVGMTGCAGGSQLKFRDPASDATNTTQSTFLTHYASMVPVTALYRSKVGQPYVIDTRWKLDYGTDKFLDGWFVLTPKFALTAEPSFVNVQFLRPFVLQGTGLPGMQLFPLPAGVGPLAAMAIHPQLTEAYFSTRQFPVGTPGKLFHMNPATGAATQLLMGDFHLMGLNRHGEMYVCEGATIWRYDVEASPPSMLGSFVLPMAPDAISFDDDNDTIGLLLPTAVSTRKQFVRLPRDLAGPLPGGGLLPGMAASILGEASLAFKPGTNQVFVCGDGVPSIYVLNAAAAGLSYLGAIPLPPASEPQAMDVDEQGHAFYISQGMVHELMESAAGGWVQNPDSIFDGQAANGFFVLSKPRTNHDRLIHEGPEFYNLLNPEVPPGVPDCYANCDMSTIAPVLNVADFTCFLQRFAAGDPDANCDYSAVPPVLNVADFTCFLQLYAAGCP